MDISPERLGLFHKKTKIAEILIVQRIPAIFFIRISWKCFLLKSAVAVLLKK